MDDLTIRSAPTEALDEATRTAAIQVCVDGFNDSLFTDLFRFTRPDSLRVMAYRGERMIGHVVISTRWMQPEGCAVLRSAYMDEVAVIRAEQGKGVGKAMMQQVTTLIQDYEIGGLETSVPNFYATVGWELWRGSLAGRGAKGLIPTPQQRGIMILRLPKTPPLDLDGWLTIEEQTERIW